MFTHQKVFLIFILLIGFYFRFLNLNWDSGYHLHPDERFLTMVGTAMKMPSNLNQYLDPRKSFLNPPNVGFPFFVYGVFPVILNKVVAIARAADTYDLFTIQGRFLSAFADLLVVLVVFKLTLLFEKRYHFHSSAKYWAALLYSAAVLPIQLSHFFAVDTFLNLFMVSSCYFSCRAALIPRRKYISVGLSAVFFGLAMATKVNAVFILPLNLLLLVMEASTSDLKYSQRLVKIGIVTAIYGLVSYITLRLANPYLFETANMLNPAISKIFLQNIASLRSFEGIDVWYPPAVQWMSKPPVIFSLVNLAVFGVGLPCFVAILVGMFRTRFTPVKTHWHLMIILGWTLLFFLYQSTQFVKAMRYFIFLYPFLAIFGGIGAQTIIEFCRGCRRYAVAASVIIFSIWPLMYSSIYLHKTTRVAASEWIYQNLKNGSVIATEHWDDPLPLLLPNYPAKAFMGKEIPVFDPDTPEKFEKIRALLKDTQYYILSSNRGWGSMPTVPQKYPLMTKFYSDLFSGKLGFRKIKDFTSYPGIPDDWADESFTVYDHPKVIIMENVFSEAGRK